MPYTLRQQEYIDSVEGEAHMSAVEIIGELELALSAGREWHTVTDALPGTNHGWVLVAVRPSNHSPYVTIGAYDDERGWRGKWGARFDGQEAVSHWMQLPAYPAGEPPAAHCHWQLSDEYDAPWQGSCGILWIFTDAGTPQEHGVNFCPRCGRPVLVAEGG